VIVCSGWIRDSLSWMAHQGRSLRPTAVRKALWHEGDRLLTPALSWRKRAEEYTADAVIGECLGRGSQGLLPGLLQGAPHEHAGHGALIVGGTTRIANGVSLLLRHSSRLAEQFGR